VKIGKFNTEDNVLVIAEIGNNHEGNLQLAEQLIDLAASTGVHAIKFQTYRTEEHISRKDETRFKRLKSFEFNEDQFEILSEKVHKAGLLFISTPFDLQSVSILEPLVDAYKISSSDNTFYPLMEKIALANKPILMSGGLADIHQLHYSKLFIERIWREHSIFQSLAVLHCVSNYPVELHEANLLAIHDIARNLGCTVGYSDHTLGIEAAVLSVAVGARIIEKHFTLDKHFSEFRDHQLSVTPDELKELVRRVKEAEQYLGSGIKEPQESEKSNMNAMRRSIIAKRRLHVGEIITMDSIRWVRPAGGIAPGNEHLILGKRLKLEVAEGDMILPEFIDESKE
jgi:sialic acid synthase SpsE